MRKSQQYLGIPNAVMLCIDAYDLGPKGRFYHHFAKEPVSYEGEIDLLLKMESLYDDLRFPFPGNNERHFKEREVVYMEKEMNKVLEDDEILDMLDSFIDWQNFGLCMMEQDGVISTQYGAIRRVEPEQPEQEAGMQLQSL